MIDLLVDLIQVEAVLVLIRLACLAPLASLEGFGWLSTRIVYVVALHQSVRSTSILQLQRAWLTWRAFAMIPCALPRTKIGAARRLLQAHFSVELRGLVVLQDVHGVLARLNRTSRKLEGKLVPAVALVWIEGGVHLFGKVAFDIGGAMACYVDLVDAAVVLGDLALLASLTAELIPLYSLILHSHILEQQGVAASLPTLLWPLILAQVREVRILEDVLGIHASLGVTLLCRFGLLLRNIVLVAQILKHVLVDAAIILEQNDLYFALFLAAHSLFGGQAGRVAVAILWSIAQPLSHHRCLGRA